MSLAAAARSVSLAAAFKLCVSVRTDPGATTAAATAAQLLPTPLLLAGVSWPRLLLAVPLHAAAAPSLLLLPLELPPLLVHAAAHHHVSCRHCFCLEQQLVCQC